MTGPLTGLSAPIRTGSPRSRDASARSHPERKELPTPRRTARRCSRQVQVSPRGEIVEPHRPLLCMEDCSERRDHAAVAELIHSGNRRSCRTEPFCAADQAARVPRRPSTRPTSNRVESLARHPRGGRITLTRPSCTLPRPGRARSRAFVPFVRFRQGAQVRP
jgi:hypothetical protein